MAETLTTAEGQIALAEDTLATTLANCARWRTMTSSVDVAEALESIYFDALPIAPNDQDVYEPEDFRRLLPFALIETEEENGVSFAQVAAGTTFHFRPSGALQFTIETEVPTKDADRLSNIMRQFKNDIGVVMNEMLAQAGVSGRLAIKSLRGSGPWRSPEEEADALDRLQYRININYGA